MFEDRALARGIVIRNAARFKGRLQGRQAAGSRKGQRGRKLVERARGRRVDQEFATLLKEGVSAARANYRLDDSGND